MKINKKNGFTLVELLVVVAIIALLVSILLPALSNAKAQTRTTLCASKHRNIFWAWTHYAHDHDGRIMPAFHGWGTEDVNAGWWPLLIRPHIDKITWRFDHSLSDANFTDKLWCPEKNGPMDNPLGSNPWIGMNQLLDGAWGRPVAESPPMPYLSSFRAAPSELVVFTDSRSYTYHYHPDWGSFVYRHSNNTSSNFIFADGHVELTRTRTSINHIPSWDNLPDAIPPKNYAYRPLESKLGHPSVDYFVYK